MFLSITLQPSQADHEDLQTYLDGIQLSVMSVAAELDLQVLLTLTSVAPSCSTLPKDPFPNFFTT